MGRRRRKKTVSKYLEDAVIANGTICRIDYANQEINGKCKSCFYCPSYAAPEGRMCIFWGRTNISVGDKVSMKGRYNDGVFLAWQIQILEKAKAENEV